MNERIGKLAEQAGMVRILEEHAHEYGNGTFKNTPYLELEKFAELIIRECADFVAEGEFGDPGAANELKKYFGIEEKNGG